MNRRDFLKGLGGFIAGLAAKIRPLGDKEESPPSPEIDLQEVVEDLTPEIEDDQFWPAALSDHSCPSSYAMLIPADDWVDANENTQFPVGAWDDTMHSLSMQRAQWVQEHPDQAIAAEDARARHHLDFEVYPPELHRGLRRLLELVEGSVDHES